MSSLTIECREVLVTDVSVTNQSLEVTLDDGRSITAPINWYPRLALGSEKERADWRLIGRGTGIHWPSLEEDISLANLLAGLPSSESSASLKRWVESRKKARSTKKGRASTSRRKNA